MTAWAKSMPSFFNSEVITVQDDIGNILDKQVTYTTVFKTAFVSQLKITNCVRFLG